MGGSVPALCGSITPSQSITSLSLVRAPPHWIRRTHHAGAALAWWEARDTGPAARFHPRPAAGALRHALQNKVSRVSMHYQSWNEPFFLASRVQEGANPMCRHLAIRSERSHREPTYQGPRRAAFCVICDAPCLCDSTNPIRAERSRHRPTPRTKDRARRPSVLSVPFCASVIL
jgi:hypothetical protein